MSDQFWIAFFTTVGAIATSFVTTAAGVLILWLKIKEATALSVRNAEAIHEVKAMVNGNNMELRGRLDQSQQENKDALARAAVLAIEAATSKTKGLVTEGRLSTIWQGLLRRGIVEAYSKGLVQTDSDKEVAELSCATLQLTPHAREAYEPIALALRQLARKAGEAITEEQLAEQIEIAFGPWLVRHVCAVMGVNEMACLAMAISVARGGEGKP